MPSSNYSPYLDLVRRTRVERHYGRRTIEDCNIPGEPSEVIRELQKRWKYWARRFDKVHEELEDCEAREQAAVAREEALIAYCQNHHNSPTADRLEKLNRAEGNDWEDRLCDMTRAKSMRDRDKATKQDIAEATVRQLQAQLNKERDKIEKLTLALQDAQKTINFYINELDDKSRENSELGRLLELAGKWGKELLKWKIDAERRESSRDQMLVSLSPVAKPGSTIESRGTVARDWSTKPGGTSEPAETSEGDGATIPDDST